MNDSEVTPIDRRGFRFRFGTDVQRWDFLWITFFMKILNDE